MRLPRAIASLIFLMAACGTHPAGAPEGDRTKAIPAGIREAKEPQPVSSPFQRTESAGGKIKPTKSPSRRPLVHETSTPSASTNIEWGREATLDDIIAMAKNNEIRQIEWHVMPNVIRAQAADGRIFHIRNENKGIDIRNALLNAGVNLGKGGVSFRHVF